MKEQLYTQLHGPGGPGAGDGAAAVAHYRAQSSPGRSMQLQLVPAEEGLIQRCSNLTLQVQQQDYELNSLRQQLLEQQLALSEAQTSCSSAERQLQQAAVELSAARAAAAEASAEAETAQQQLQQLQQVLAQQQPELSACRARVQKLEAQQQVLLGKCVD